MMSENEIVDKLKALFKDQILESKIPRTRRVFIKIKKSALKDIVAFLSKDLGVKHLSTITGVDLGEEIELIYHFAYEGTIAISLRVAVPKNDPKITSVVSLVPGATLYEREVHDLLGVIFEGHPDLSRLILPEEWPKGLYPLRKEYSTEELREKTRGAGGKT